MNATNQTENLSASEMEAQLKQLEVRAVFDLSLSILKGNPEEGLFRILENYLLEQLGISHLSVFFLDEGRLSGSFVYGKMAAGWKTLPMPKPGIQVQRLQDFLPEFQHANPHLDWIIPIGQDGRPEGILLCQSPDSPDEKTRDSAVLLLRNISGLMLMARENHKLVSYRIRQESLRKEMEIARQVQTMLFPAALPQNEHLHAYASYLPHQEVSGDYYDFIPLADDDFAFCVADVSGKGFPAALLMSNFQACLRTLMMDFSDLSEVVKKLNRHLVSCSRGERFITAFLGVYRQKGKKLQYVNCGHIPPYLLSSGDISLLDKGCTLLGMFNDLPALTVGETPVHEGSLIAAFTDGLPELENAAGEEYGEERLSRFFLENLHEKLPVLHQRLLNRLEAFSGPKGFNDDLTLFTLKFGG